MEEKAAAAILAKLAIRGQEKGTHAGIGRNLLITFVTKNGYFETQFVHPDQLDCSAWGQILLKDNGFYKAICAEVSKRLGRPYGPF